VKQARAEAGLSLAQVGKGHVTAPAIYLIETGRTRPSLPTLEHIARRTGKPVEFFLADPDGSIDETQTRLHELEAMVADGKNEDAIHLGRWLLDQGASPYRLGRIRLLLGQAHLASSQPERAAAFLAQARAHFEAVNDGPMLAECIGSQAALANMTKSKDAVALAEKALAICRGLSPVPTPIEARLLAILATAHVASRDWDNAITVFEQAIDASSDFFDLRRLARLYSGLSTAYNEQGHAEAAARYGMRSVALLEVQRDRIDLARSESNLALILMTRGHFSAARQHLDRSLALSEEADLEAGRSQVLLSLCELSLQEGSDQQALDYAQHALEMAERLGEEASVAEAHSWLGRIADGGGDHQAADREFELAISSFEELGMRERLLQCHGAYAEILERRGELAKAYVHMKLALQASRPGLLRPEEPVEEEEERVSSA
jgi:tetratricopeptide (TPR) repeat protein/DNA-binding XRE family transcriptional regulator